MILDVFALDIGHEKAQEHRNLLLVMNWCLVRIRGLGCFFFSWKELKQEEDFLAELEERGKGTRPGLSLLREPGHRTLGFSTLPAGCLCPAGAGEGRGMQLWYPAKIKKKKNKGAKPTRIQTPRGGGTQPCALPGQAAGGPHTPAPAEQGLFS